MVEHEQNEADEAEKAKLLIQDGRVTYPATIITREGKDGGSRPFTPHVEAGGFRASECLVLLGENGCGKSSFMNMLAGAQVDKNSKSAIDLPRLGLLQSPKHGSETTPDRGNCPRIVGEGNDWRFGRQNFSPFGDQAAQN